MEASLRDQAIDQAYREHAAEVYRLAFGVLRDRDEAIDVSHDAFARAWERWDQYDSNKPLRAWLHGIVVHLALDRLRRQRVRRLALPALGNAAVNEINAGRGRDLAADVVNRDVVAEALASLPGPVRAALVLRHYYGYDYREIGAFLGMRSGTVGSTLSRAHTELRRRLVAPDDATRAAGQGTTDRPPGTDRAPGPGQPKATDFNSEPPEVIP